MTRIFIDPGTRSAGVVLVSESSDGYTEFDCLNPKVEFPSGSLISFQYRNVRVMLQRISDAVWELMSRISKTDQVEVYIEQPFIGRLSTSVLVLSGLFFQIPNVVFRNALAQKFEKPVKVFALHPATVSTQDRKVKREREDRKPFACGEFSRILGDEKILSTSRSWELMRAGPKSQDDVATAFLFWYYLFGPGCELTQGHDITQEIPLEFYQSELVRS